MKGTCYAGIVRLPEHPDADMHGLIRVVIQERTIIAVFEKLQNAGISSKGLWTCGIWQKSKSHAEIVAAERHYGVLLACPIELQYLTADNYRPIPKALLRGKKHETPESKPRSGITPQTF